MDRQDSNIIILDEPGSIRQRALGAMAVLVLVASLAFSAGRFIGGDSTEAATQLPSNHQTVVEMCGRWNVPEYLQPLANAAYPSWNWVCRLVQ